MEEFFLTKQAAMDAYAERSAKAEARKREKLNSLTSLTVEQAAAYLQVSKDVIYDLCKSGELPRQKVGRAIRIKRADLDQLSVEDDW